MTRRRSVRLAAAAAITAGSLGIIGNSADAKPDAPGPLRILLTNDDGWDAPGITAVFDALVAAGHDVTLVAPATNQSGVGGRITFGGPPLAVTMRADRKYSVAGTPADATEVGLSVVFAGSPPDLVVSGTNSGQNVGAATVHSGTVGAAVSALNDGVPAIAISTEQSLTTGVLGSFPDTAAFLVRLIATMQAKSANGELLPSGVGLNVNYPFLEPGASVTGVALTDNGRGFLDLGYTGSLPSAVGTTSSLAIAVNPFVPETVANADTTALAANQVSISAIEPDYDADPDGKARVRVIINALK